MSAENEIRNINLFGDIKRIKQDLFDAVHPIGEIYVQYPQQDDPMTLYNKDGVTSVWEEQLQYNGAFFRSSNAVSTIWGCDDLPDEYFLIDGSNNVTPARVVAENGGGVSIGADTGNTKTIDGKVYKEYSVTGYSTAAASYINKTNPLTKQGQATALNGIHGNSQTISGGSHSHTLTLRWRDQDSGGYGSYTREGSNTQTFTLDGGNHNHTFTPSISSNDIETRPENYTVILWRRQY